MTLPLYKQLTDATLRILSNEGDAEAVAELRRRVRAVAEKLQRSKSELKHKGKRPG